MLRLAYALGVCFLIASSAAENPYEGCSYKKPPIQPYDCASCDVSGNVAAFDSGFGLVLGNKLSRVEEFLGIPYATSERFQKPMSWTTRYGSGYHSGERAERCNNINGQRCSGSCVQSVYGKNTTVGVEECLFMNIWKYAGDNEKEEAERLPILFFIHGGAFVHGTGCDFNGTGLATLNKAIVVTFNYRLGPLGFFPGLSESGDDGISGNFGLQDQREALRFIHKLAPRLNGDTNRILLFGESAGAISVQLHTVLPKSQGLFTSVLSESGYSIISPRAYAVQKARNWTAQVQGCSLEDDDVAMACLKAKSADDLARDMPTPPPFEHAVGWGPNIDLMSEFPDNPLALLIKGRFSAGDVAVAGTNTNEGTMFVYPAYPAGMSAEELRDYSDRLLNRNGYRPLTTSQMDRLNQLYPAIENGDNRRVASRIDGEATFICGSRFFLRAVGGASSTKTFMYHFDFKGGYNDKLCNGGEWGVCHASELPYVFQGLGRPFPSAEDEALAEKMGRNWGSFAAGAAPSDKAWPLYDAASDKNIRFAEKTTEEEHYLSEVCDFWEEIIRDYARQGGAGGDDEDGIGVGWIIALTLLLLGCAGGAFVYYRKAREEEPFKAIVLEEGPGYSFLG